MWRHLAPHDALRPWQRRAMVGIDGFDDGQQQVVLTLYGGAWHWWLSCWFLMCGLGGWSARQGWATIIIECYVQGIGLVGTG